MQYGTAARALDAIPFQINVTYAASFLAVIFEGKLAQKLAISRLAVSLTS
jgi:hypothetical protein